MTSFARHLSLSILGPAALIAAVTVASAQSSYPPYGAPAGGVCQRLEAQLANIDRSAVDPARAEQVRRTEDALGRQQAELDRVSQQARRNNCDAPAFFQIFGGGGRPEVCGPLNNQIQQLRSNIARAQADLQRMQSAGASYERDGQRRAVIAALAQNDCGPQYRQQAAQSRNFFEQLFGAPGSIIAPEQDPGNMGGHGGGYRTVCVRTCDGYFFPISFSTSQDRFHDDEATCQRMCPASEVALYAHRNPGEDIRQAVSISGRPYTELPNAFKYRQEFNPACSCKAPGETWANAVKDDPSATAAYGDIIVTDERAKQMSVPRDAKGRPIMAPAQKAGQKGASPAPVTASTPAEGTMEPATPLGEGEPKKPIRSVGPIFLPQQ
jgi:hypothetical protein